MQIETRETGYDKISIAYGTKAEIESSKDKLENYELAIATAKYIF